MNVVKRIPAEWEDHYSTIICWPHQKADWPGKFLPIHWVYTEIVKKLKKYELVRIIVQSENYKNKVISYLTRAEISLDNIEFLISESDRGWMRDTSPQFVYDDAVKKAVSFKFNGWAKYDNWKKDSRIPEIIAKAAEVELVTAVYNGNPVVLEGGAIDYNGKGCLITTEECLLDKKIQVRNPGLTRADYDAIFSDTLGINQVIWLGKGIAGDDTHGHVDDLCRFVNENTVLLCRETNSKDENYSILEENFERLQGIRLANDSSLNVISIPMPETLRFEGMRLPASYANFYICNKQVLVPVFNDPNDRKALNIIQDCFPDRTVSGIYAGDLVWGLGTLHCLTHEEPVSQSNKERL